MTIEPSHTTIERRKGALRKDNGRTRLRVVGDKSLSLTAIGELLFSIELARHS